MVHGVGTAVSIWSRSELRRRWKGLVLLGVLAGLAAGLALAAVDGARRSSTSYDRMRERLVAADAIFFPTQVRIDDADVTKLATIPEVAAWGGFALTAGQLDGFPPGSNPLVAVGSDWFDGIERPKILAGRLPDPARDDEAVITEPLLAEGAKVGMELTWRTLSPEQIEVTDPSSSPDFDWATSAEGPTTVLKVVGVVRLPMESVVSFASDGLLLTGPGWAEQHLDQVAHATNAIVRLRDGAADVPAFAEGVAAVYGRSDVPIKDLSNDIKRIQSSVDLERTALLLFALAVVAAGAVIVGQGFVRSVRAGGDSVGVLQAMGLGRRGLVLGLALPHALPAAVAVPVTLVTAAMVSTRLPIGLARRLDPELGLHVDWGLTAAGLALLLLAIAGVVLITAAVLVRRFGRIRQGRHRVVGAAGRLGAPLPVALGASLALEPAVGRSPGPVRPALVAAVGGVVAIAAALTLVGGIDDALHRPARVGTVWDLELSSEMDEATARKIVVDEPDIAAAALVRRVATTVDGVDAPLYSLDPITGSLRFVILRGHEPEAPDEVAVGPRTAEVAGIRVGDLVAVGPNQVRVQVVGIGLLPQTPHSSFDEGAILTSAGLEALELPEDEILISGLARLRSGADVAAVADRFTAAGIYAVPPAKVPDVANLANVRSLPLVLAAFLGLLAIGAVAHALLTGARRRAHDLAVLRALGLTPRQTAACVTWQAAVIGVLALVIGIPLGLIIGRQVWRTLAERAVVRVRRSARPPRAPRPGAGCPRAPRRPGAGARPRGLAPPHGGGPAGGVGRRGVGGAAAFGAACDDDAMGDDWARPVVHWEIEAIDPERQRAFYGALFGWKIGEGPIMLIEPGVGGPEPGPGGHLRRGEQSRVTLYVQVRDLAESLVRVAELGGNVVLPPFDVEGGPTLAAVQDPEGNPLMLVQQ